ncbi:MAG TPA: aminopeptidase N [Actinomycetaceae bacterium]|nr:aminopeptidase N [Actinomycetaceae bacterium]
MPGTNLTRTEARERAATIQTASYEVTLDLATGSAETFRSRTRVRFTARPGADTFFDLIARSVEEITLNGEAINPETAFADSRVILSGLAGDNELVVDATMEYSRTGEGLHRFTDPADREVYLYSQFEVADSRRVFAVAEQPDLKATFQFTVSVPAHWTVFSNEREDRIEGDDDVATWYFPPTPPLSSYVTAIVAGPYHVGEREFSFRTGDGRDIPMRVACRASLGQYLDTAELQDVAAAGMQFYEEAYRQPYPFSKYDQVFVPEFNAGAMENASCVTFTETYVFRSKVPEATRERRIITNLHELAHMWFGDLVTMEWWDDLWLNESFAEFMSHLAMVEATEWKDAWTTFNTLEKSWALSQDQLPSTHPIVAPINDLADVEVNFDGITYAKGASVLRQLVAWVGQEEFLAGVANYVARRKWGNTVLADLLSELEATSGRELAEWSKAWLETAGVNTLRPEIETEVRDGAEVITSFAIRQLPDAAAGILRPHRLVVGTYDLDDGGRLTRRERIELDVDGELTDVPQLAGSGRPDLILLNDEDLAYCKIRLDDVSLATATSHLSVFSDSLARSLVLAAAWDMTRDGEWSATRFVDLVLGNIGSITDSTVVVVLLRQLETSLQHYSAPDGRDVLVERAADTLLRLAREAEAGSDLQFQLTKAFALHACTPAQLDTVAALRSGREVLDGLEMDTDLSWDLLVALAAGRLADEHDIEDALEADPTATGEQSAVRARAALPTHKQAAWESLFGEEHLANMIQLNTLLGFERAHDRAILGPYVTPYFERLESIWTERTPEMAEQLVTRLFPLGLTGLAAGGDVVARAQNWLDSHPGAPAALRRLVTEQQDFARRAQVAQQVDARGEGSGR